MARTASASSRKGARPFRPFLELLEDRTLPSITTVGVPTWTAQGPAMESQQQFGNGSTGPNDPVTGAVESIAVNPNNPAQIIAGTVNGGVWRTTNANAANPGAITWTPLTDQLSSLSIGIVAYDPGDATGNTFYAGTGLWSNGFSSGGSAVGLYRTQNAGQTWTLLGDNNLGVNILAGHRIKALAITGQTILVGAIDGTGTNSDPSRNYADLGGEMFRSTDGGLTFSQVLPASGLPSGAVSSIVVDPNNAQQVFATIAGQGVFRSANGGATWTAFSTGLTGAAGSADVEVVAQNVGGVTTLFAGVSQEPPNANTATLAVFRTSTLTGSGNWTALAALPAGFNAGLGFAEKFQLAADPVNAGVVYVDGQGATGIYRYNTTVSQTLIVNASGTAGTPVIITASVPHGLNTGDQVVVQGLTGTYAALNNATYFVTRINATQFSLNGTTSDGSTAAGGSFTLPSWIQIDQAGAQNTAPHADSRDLRFLNNTTLLEADDGGIYLMQNPTSASTSSWNSFDGNLADLEVYSVAYDSTNQLYFAGTQDNGSPHQDASNGVNSTATDLTGGDGQFQAVDTTSLGNGNVLGYSLSNNFAFFTRNQYNSSGALVNPTNVVITGASNGSPIVITSPTSGLQTGEGVVISGVKGDTAANGGWYVTVVDTTHFSLNNSNGVGSGVYLGGGRWNPFNLIQSASGTAGTPVIITTSLAHGLNTGDQVLIQGLTGTYAALNGSNYYVTRINATQFSLNGTVSDGSTAAGGFVQPSNKVLLKSAIGAANLSGLNAADQAFASTGGFDQHPFVLDSVNPQQMLLGYTGVYEDANTSPANGLAGDVITNITANVGTLTGTVSALAYGGKRAGTSYANVAFVGTRSGQLFFRGETGASFTNVTAQLGSFSTINSIALDPADWQRVYVVTNNRLYFTANVTNLAANPFRLIGGGSNDNLNSLIAPLGSLAPELRSVTVVGSTPVVGALGGIYRMLTPPAGANPMATWSKYGTGLPDVVVTSMVYSVPTNTLVVGTMGRGVWTLANASTTITVSGVLTVTGDANANDMSLTADPNNPLRFLVNDGTGAAAQSLDKTNFTLVNFQGLAGDDMVRIDATVIPLMSASSPDFVVRVDGGTGNNTLEVDGPSSGLSWDVTGLNAGNAANGAVTFLAVENLRAGAVQDVFHLLAGGSLSGTISGNGGSDFLDYSSRNTPVVVNLATGQATSTGGVQDVDNVLGSASGGDTLTGNDQANILVGHNANNTLRAAADGAFSSAVPARTTCTAAQPTTF